VGALLEQRCVVVGRVAVDHDDLTATGLVAECLQQALALQLANPLIVEGDIGINRTLREPVVGDHLDALLLGLGRDVRRGLAVHRIQHEYLCTFCQRCLSLLLLLARVLIGVGVEDLATRTQLLELCLEERAIV
jgi:hypothetical protein